MMINLIKNYPLDKKQKQNKSTVIGPDLVIVYLQHGRLASHLTLK